MRSQRSFSRPHTPDDPTRGLAAAVLLLLASLSQAAVARPAGAQGATITNPPKTQELGIDAGVTVGLGSNSSVQATFPAARARVGFFLTNESRISLEPAAFMSYTKVSGVSGKFVYDLEAGALYHFSPPAEVYNATRATVAYLRPFVEFTGASGGGSNNEVSIGGGLGVKIPWRQDLAFRLEGNFGYGFRNEAARLGAFAGLSFFTRRGIPTGG